MALDIPVMKYSGRIKEIVLGKGDKALTVGGETCYPFHLFEGQMAFRPRIAMEVHDSTPEDWAPAALEPFADVAADPVAWAKKCVNTYGAEMIALQLVSTDPNGENRSADKAAELTKRVADAVDVPMIVWGCNNAEKDTDVLRKIAEDCAGRNLMLGPVTEANYKQIGAVCIGYEHTVIASTPIDINLAKQLNILLGNLGVPDGRILIDPTTGALGYGLEYSYSVMERIRMAALTQEDERLQFPIICNLGKEIWKIKEAKLSREDAPRLGDPHKRGILLEAMTAQLCLLAGANILVMRHPKAVDETRKYIQRMMTI